MKILAIESATKVASVALWEDHLLCEMTLTDQLTHSQTLLPMIEAVLIRSNVEIDEVDAFAIDVGPGSFTGIRIGICTANALALAKKKPVIAVNSPSILATKLPFFNGVICPLIDARNDQVFAGLFQNDFGEIQSLCELFAGSIVDYLGKLPLDQLALFIGDGAAAQQRVIKQRLGERAIFAPSHLSFLDARSCAYLAQIELEKNNGIGTKKAMPLYLRKTQAERLVKHANI